MMVAREGSQGGRRRRKEEEEGTNHATETRIHGGDGRCDVFLADHEALSTVVFVRR